MSTRPSIASVSTRVEDHERRIEDLEMRLAKYDVIIARLDTLIDVLSRRVETVAGKAEDAIEGQELIRERNRGGIVAGHRGPDVRAWLCAALTALTAAIYCPKVAGSSPVVATDAHFKKA